jgi:hypothetical protein
MRAAAFYAGLILNAGFLEFALQTPGRGANVLAMVIAPLLWGLFLVFGAYLVPARTGMGPRELLEAQLGRWAGGFVWWIVLPVWAVSWFDMLTGLFAYTVHAPFFRWQESDRLSIDTRIAVYWPWVLLTGLAGLKAVDRATSPLKISAIILAAAPFAYRHGWPEAAQYLGEVTCCFEKIWAMQNLTLWLAPSLLFAGRFEERSLRLGMMGIVLPMVGATTVGFLTSAGSTQLRNTMNYLAAVGGNGPERSIKIFLLSFTLLATGRFCVALLCEHLGEWRRWWVVFPMISLLIWGLRFWPSRLEWQVTAVPFVALAGVMCAGYLHRKAFAFTAAEQVLAAVAWVCGSAFGVAAYFSEDGLPFFAWLIGFGLAWTSFKVRSYWRPA